ncbi:hypothetical protein ACQ4PT_022406 [Festuca glaucescens]
MASSAAFYVLLLLLVAIPLPPTAASNSRSASTTAATAFGRSSWVTNLTLVGSASILPGETAASFSTRFTFRIVASPSFGDGLAFIITSSDSFLGASDGYLGLYPSAPESGDDVSTVAVELDTHRDVALGDRDGNHVALDANSIFSIASATPGLDLKAGVPITAWVEYSGPRRRVRAWISSASRRPSKPTLSVHIDLSSFLDTFVFIGFSASNNPEGKAIHIVESWTFRTYWAHSGKQGPPPSVPPPSPLRQPPLNNANTPMPLPVTSHHRHLVFKFIAGFICASIVLLIIAVVFCRGRRPKVRRAIELSRVNEKRRMLPRELPRST